jgi:sortase A
VRTALRGIGQLLMTPGVVVLLFGVHSLYGTGLQTARAQSELRDDLRQTWATAPDRPREPAATSAPAPPPVLGEGVAVLRVPRLGDSYDPAVVEGVGREELKKGPGHYPGSAMPGEVGNLVLAGHRTTYGAPFGRYGELEVGDEVTVERRDEVFSYRIISREIVAPDDVSARQRPILTAELETAQKPADAGVTA